MKPRNAQNERERGNEGERQRPVCISLEGPELERRGLGRRSKPGFNNRAWAKPGVEGLDLNPKP